MVVAGRVAASEPPFIDEHARVVAAPPDRVWGALREYVEGSLTSGNELLHRLLGTDPPAGFAVVEAVRPRRLELAGRHRFARYVLAFELEEAQPGSTRLAARSYAAFPGIRGRVYRALVIGTRLHVVATRQILRTVERRARGG